MKLPSPNRIAVYLTAAASLLGGLAPAVAGLDLASTAGIVAGLVSIGTVVHKFLTGWQQYEAAIYQHDLNAQAAAARAEQVAAAGKVGGAGPRLNLPR